MTNDDIVSAARRAGVVVSAAPREHCTRIRAAFRAPHTRALWEGLDGLVRHDSGAWRLVGDLPFHPVVVFFEPVEDDRCWMFAEGSDVARTLAELPAVVFYAADVAGTGLFAFNDHDVAIAVGTARRVLEGQ